MLEALIWELGIFMVGVQKKPRMGNEGCLLRSPFHKLARNMESPDSQSSLASHSEYGQQLQFVESANRMKHM